MPNIKYGPVEVFFNEKPSPTREMFYKWKKDFLKLPEAKFFKIYVAGTFVDRLYGKDVDCSDVDIVLTGCDDIKKIEKLILEGTKLGFKKYSNFFDVLFYETFDVFDDNIEYNNNNYYTKIYLLSDKFYFDGVEAWNFPDAVKVSDNLWEINRPSLTDKHISKITGGYLYPKPMRIGCKPKVTYKRGK